MKSLELVIFDMDGLLFDTERIYYAAIKKVMEQHGYDFPFETYCLLVGVADHESDVILKEIYGDDFSFDLILKDYQREFRALVKTEGITLKAGVDPLLAALNQKGLKKCIASSSSREHIESFLSISGLTDRFDFYVSGEEVERGKPNPDIFLEACRRANVNPSSALVLEDSLNGLRAAVQAGIKCIIVPDLITPNDEMNTNAHSILSNLEEVIDLL